MLLIVAELVIEKQQGRIRGGFLSGNRYGFFFRWRRMRLYVCLILSLFVWTHEALLELFELMGFGTSVTWIQRDVEDYSTENVHP